MKARKGAKRGGGRRSTTMSQLTRASKMAKSGGVLGL